MEILEVTTPQQAREFIMVNVMINKSNPNYIRPLDKDINEVFDPEKNKAFRHGECKRWILKNNMGELLGRIAAFVNKKYKNRGDDMPVGGIGFFDCVNKQIAADYLFDTARIWLKGKGMQAMDGPINFGERDRWWGLLIEGFQDPLYCMNYNPPYYKALFEHYGFKVFFDQICFGMDAKKRVNEKMYARHKVYESNPSFTAAHASKKNLEKLADDFTSVYNKAWAGHGAMKEVRKDQILNVYKKMKPILDERILWFAYKDGQPISMFINIPDLNQYFKYLNGGFSFFHKVLFLSLKIVRPTKRFVGIAFGIVPEFQGKGIDAFMVVEAAKIIQPRTRYTDYEMQWIGDFNPKMLNVAQSVGDAFITRKLATYRFLFDPTREFRRHPIIA